MIYVRVILPRGDDKISREQEKEVAKDMKESISRMGQVYDAMHQLGQSTIQDTIMRHVFRKAKVTFIRHYEKGLLQCIVAMYPEYKEVVESAIAAQFADASIEMLSQKPQYFLKKHSYAMPVTTLKNAVFPIKTFKQMPDDPINDIVDTMGKMSPEDTFTIVMPVKPIGDSFNKKAKNRATGLYRRDTFYVKGGHNRIRKWFFPPYRILALFIFLVNGNKQRR